MKKEEFKDDYVATEETLVRRGFILFVSGYLKKGFAKSDFFFSYMANGQGFLTLFVGEQKMFHYF